MAACNASFESCVIGAPGVFAPSAGLAPSGPPKARSRQQRSLLPASVRAKGGLAEAAPGHERKQEDRSERSHAGPRGGATASRAFVGGAAVVGRILFL